MEQALWREIDSDTKASLMLSLEALGDSRAAFVEILNQSLRAEEEARVRLAAALILARRAGPDVAPQVARVLLDSIANEEAVSHSYVFSVWDKEPAKEACDAVSGIGANFAIASLLNLLPVVGNKLAAYSIVDTLMEMNFQQTWGGEKVSPLELTEVQRRVLTAFAGTSSIWQGNAMKTLEWHYGLPGDREKLQQFLREEAE